MTISPFDIPTEIFQNLTAAMEDASTVIPDPDGDGAMHEALLERLMRYRHVLTLISEVSATIATATADQAHEDRSLALYPTHEDVAVQRDSFTAAVARGDTKTAVAESVLLDEMWHRRKEKKAAHEDCCAATVLTLNQTEDDLAAATATITAPHPPT